MALVCALNSSPETWKLEEVSANALNHQAPTVEPTLGLRHWVTIVDEKDTLLIQKHVLHRASMYILYFIFPTNSCMYLLHGQVPAHMLGNDTHVRAMK